MAAMLIIMAIISCVFGIARTEAGNAGIITM